MLGKKKNDDEEIRAFWGKGAEFTGKVSDDLNTPLFAVEEGAFFEGTCHMARSEAEVHTLPLEQTAAEDKG